MVLPNLDLMVLPNLDLGKQLLPRLLSPFKNLSMSNVRST